jgi:hypothetical protein
MDEWIGFFGVSVSPALRLDPAHSSGSLLQTIPQLAQLQMWFRDPKEREGYRESPWVDGARHDELYTCCQRVMVDWVMTFAWPFVKTLPKVTIGGAVKHDSKVKWDALLALPAYAKDVAIDHAAKERAILNTPPNLL